MPQTLLILDLLIQEPCVDLREVSRVVLGDLGATLQILRVAGREYGNAEGRPTRVEDCIADIGLEACLKAVSAQTVANDGRRTSVGEFWAHSRRLRSIPGWWRRICRDQSRRGVSDRLLHAIGMLRHAGVERAPGLTDGALAGLRIAKRSVAAHPVMELFNRDAPDWLCDPVVGNCAEGPPARDPVVDKCPFEQGAGPGRSNADGPRSRSQ